jgi:hypothetical protein
LFNPPGWNASLPEQRACLSSLVINTEAISAGKYTPKHKLLLRKPQAMWLAGSDNEAHAQEGQGNG